MPVMLKDGRSVLFVHVPKAGGTTLERHFGHDGWKLAFRETLRKRPDLFPLRRCSPQHYHGAVLTEMFDVSRFDVVFTVVREPVSRFRSEFAMRNNTLQAAPAATVDAWAERKLAEYADNPYLLDNHLRPQHEFLVPGVLTYRLEDGLEAVVKDLNQRFDLDLPPAVLHRLRSDDRGLPSSAVEISPQLRARLHDFYAKDFADFGYDA